jgi:hypothetical protein
MSATLTLGCNTYQLNPPATPVTACYDSMGWSVSSTNGGTITQLTVNAIQDPAQQVTFKSNVDALTANFGSGVNGDGTDRLIFQGTVGRSLISTGSGLPLAGDEVRFNSSVTQTTLNTSIRNDTIVFANSTTNGTTINAFAGSDSIQFTSSARVGPATVINLGIDSVADTISVAAKSTFAGSGIVINNFKVGQDVILAGTSATPTTIRNQAEANAFFGSGVTLNS